MSKKMLGPKKLGSNKILGKKIFWAKQYFGKKNRLPKNVDRKSLVKIGSETAEIFLYGEMLPGKMLPG